MKSNMLRLALLGIGVFLTGVSAHQAMGAPTVFFARDDSTGLMPNSLAKFNHFTTALGSFGVENVETISGMNPTLVFGTTGITASTQGVMTQAALVFAIDDYALLETDSFVGPANTTFTFNQPITAFGLYVIQGGDVDNNNPTTFRLRDTVGDTFVDVPVQVGPGWEPTNVFFLGVTDNVPFNQVEIIETGDVADGMLYDNVVAGFVPEPNSLALMVLGVAAVAGRARRLRRS